MQCFTCNLSPICKIFQTINDSKMVADITINNCKMYQGQYGMPAVNQQVPQQHPPQQPLRPQRSPEQLSAMNDIIRQKQQEIKETEEVELSIEVDNEESSAPVVPLKRPCGTCGYETTRLFPCDGCGQEICDGCAVNSAEDGKKYCEPCWDKM